MVAGCREALVTMGSYVVRQGVTDATGRGRPTYPLTEISATGPAGLRENLRWSRGARGLPRGKAAGLMAATRLNEGTVMKPRPGEKLLRTAPAAGSVH